jgi:uncharacterized membrane protein
MADSRIKPGNERTISGARVALAGVMAAFVFVVTFLVRVPLPFTSGGYLNLGDTVVYIAAFLLGGPLGALSGGIGSALADVLAGAADYAPATLIIKALMGFVFGTMAKDGQFKKYTAGAIVCGAIMVAGYFVADFIIAGLNVSLAIADLPFNCIQWAGGTVAAAVLYPAISSAARRVGVRSRTGRTITKGSHGKDSAAQGNDGKQQ